MCGLVAWYTLTYKDNIINLSQRIIRNKGHSHTKLFSSSEPKGRLGLNPGLNLTQVFFSCVQKHFLG